jgi:hypothetical protein
VVNGFASSADVDHDMADRTANAQRILIIGRIVGRCYERHAFIFPLRAGSMARVSTDVQRRSAWQ